MSIVLDRVKQYNGYNKEYENPVKYFSLYSIQMDIECNKNKNKYEINPTGDDFFSESLDARIHEHRLGTRLQSGILLQVRKIEIMPISEGTLYRRIFVVLN